MQELTDVQVVLSPPIARAITRDRQLGHSHVMASLPSGLGDTPRKNGGVLWRIAPGSHHLTVRYRSVPVGVTNLGIITSTTPVLAAGRLQISMSINCQKTPPTRFPKDLHETLKAHGGAYRSRLVIVPEAERPTWVVNKLRAHGFEIDPDSIALSKQYAASLGPRRGGAIPAIDVTAAGVVIDETTFAARLAAGLGKGKNFGLGPILLS